MYKRTVAPALALHAMIFCLSMSASHDLHWQLVKHSSCLIFVKLEHVELRDVLYATKRTLLRDLLLLAG